MTIAAFVEVTPAQSRPVTVLQVAACVNAVRQDPDGFACQYPCDYSQWRSDVIYPVRGPLVSAGTSGANELDA